jgi:hypothetical protein
MGEGSGELGPTIEGVVALAGLDLDILGMDLSALALISCSQPWPAGASSTRRVSCGLIHVGGSADGTEAVDLTLRGITPD